MLRSIIDKRWSPQGIVFDMDGVLLHSSSIHGAAYQEALREFPIRNFSYARVAGMRSSDESHSLVLQPLFHCVLHSGDVRNAKPSPEIFESAIARLGLDRASSLVVEDAVAGIQAAKAARAVACGIPSTSSAEELERAGADLMIDRLEDLLDLGDAR